MKLVKQSVERLWKSPLLVPVQAVELSGRTCYKSESKITPDSAEKFVSLLKESGHTAMLEHCWFTLKVPESLFSRILGLWHRPYLFMSRGSVPLISGNATAFNNMYIDYPMVMHDIQHELHSDYPILFDKPDGGYRGGRVTFYTGELNAAERLFHQAYSYKIITCRGVTHELVRHRPFSYAQESTRYVNYKNGVTFVIPPWVGITPDDDIDMYKRNCSELEWHWLDHCENVENYYTGQSANGWTAQKARGGLIIDLKTEIVITGNVKMFEFMFSLRCAKAAHPQMVEVANLIYEDMYDGIKD